MFSAFTFRGSKSENVIKAKSQSDAPNWWKSGSVYQIWPRSFKDSNGDGIGDIPGILSKLDYLQELGVEVVWLSPAYDSPQEDYGYDISDYESVYPPYGTMEDMDKLISGLHDRGMRLLLDLVINHTSAEHKWFQESKKSRNNPKSDWYIWKEPKFVDGKRYPPNNWISGFRGSAWEWCEERQQYYLHIFAKGQPDLNWENETTRKAIYDSAMHFWFKKGIDGFRIDTANIYSKVQSYPDGPVSEKSAPYGEPGPFVSNGPRIHEFYREIRREVLNHYVDGDPMMVGELGGNDFQTILKYVACDRRELSMVFDFEVCFLGGMMIRPKHEATDYLLPELKTALEKTQDLVGNSKAWSSVFFENHDNPRSISKHGAKSPQYVQKSGKVLAMLLGTLSGTMFIYQGQEIGMSNMPSTWSPSDLRDVDSLNYWHEMNALYPNDLAMLRRAWLGIVRTARDNSRTPVQWSTARHAGFSSGEKAEPWMRINDNYLAGVNVEEQMRDEENSLWGFWKRVLKVRKMYREVLVEGMYDVFDYNNLDTYSFLKYTKEGRFAFVTLNFSEQEQDVVFPQELKGKKLKLVLANEDKPAEKLGAWEGRLYVEEGDCGEEVGKGEKGFVFV